MKTIKKIIVVLIVLVFIPFLFIYRSYNLKKLQQANEALQTTQKQNAICVDEYKPVCGEDKKTYSNKCVAEKINAVKVAYEGECKEDKSTEKIETGSGIGENNLGDAVDSTGENVNSDSTGSGNTEEVLEDKISAGYFENLRSQCTDDGCCLASVDTMEQGNYKEAIDDTCSVGYESNILKCYGSYKWCSKKTDTQSGGVSPNTNSGSDLQVALNGENYGKVLNYFNSSFNYGFSIPSNTYFSGYGAQAGANHTVGINTSSGNVDYGDNPVKVLFYKGKILPELQDSVSGIYQDKNGMTYMKLGENSIIIDAKAGNDKIVQMIMNTIYVK